MPGWFLLVLWAILLHPLPSGASWLPRIKPTGIVDVFSGSNADKFRGSCSGISHQATCWCGEGPHRRQTIVDVQQCPYSTAWGSQCEPCSPDAQLCERLQHCARCSQRNPQAICADCPPDRYGLLCDKERPCQTPNVTEHMTIHPYFTRKGHYKLEFRCSGGRVREGPKAIRCLKNLNKWTKEPPKCVMPMRCSNLPTRPIPFTRVKENHRSERVVYECDLGYAPSGKVLETVLQCENGIWVQVGASVQCEPSPKCVSLPTFLGARLRIDSAVKSIYHAGETVQYECEESFQPVLGRGTNFTLVCTGKQWHGVAPECELKGCERLKLEHGNVTYHADPISRESDYFPLHTTAHAVCQKAYTLENPGNVTCSRTGLWKPAAPKCVPKACEDLERGKMCSVPPPSVYVIPETNKTEIYPGQTVKFGCKEKSFRKLHVGEAERICLHNGTLSGSQIQCSPVLVCTILLPDEDRHVKFCRGRDCTKRGKDILQEKTYDLPPDMVPLSEQVEFSCDSQYYCLDGDPTHRCLPRPGSEVIRVPRCKPVCGMRKYPKRRLIMGGHSSSIEAWPWQAALMEVRWEQVEFSCGATLVDDRWAVTAAHCVTFENSTRVRDTEHMRLTYGMSSSKESINRAASDRKYKVARVIIHDHYDGHSLNNDIALLRLDTPVEIGYHVGVACLPSVNQRLVGGEEGVVTGWGRTESQNLSNDLRELPLTVVNASQCKQHYEEQGYNSVVITDGMFCAMSNSTLSDTTDGDSGGPLVVQDDDGRWVLEGIVSWGAPDNEEEGVNRRAHVRLSKGESLLPTCKGSACFGGYTRVSNYIQWIREQTRGRVGSPRCGL